LEDCLNSLVNKIKAVVALAQKEPDAQNLQQIAKLVRKIEQCSIDADKSVGNPQTIISVKRYIQELFHILSPPGASILKAVEEDGDQSSRLTDHLKGALATFAGLPNTSSRLLEELSLIAQDLHHLHDQPRHIG
jgi:hypothetical protein